MSRKQAKKKKKKDASSQHTLKGVLDITRSGIGYVMVENLPNDILVRPNDFNTALHGDTVRVRVFGGPAKKSGRQQGQVVEVLHRKQMEFLGKLEISRNGAFFVADTEKPMPDVIIPSDSLNGANNNDRVIIRITEWEKQKKPDMPGKPKQASHTFGNKRQDRNLYGSHNEGKNHYLPGFLLVSYSPQTCSHNQGSGNRAEPEGNPSRRSRPPGRFGGFGG